MNFIQFWQDKKVLYEAIAKKQECDLHNSRNFLQIHPHHSKWKQNSMKQKKKAEKNFSLCLFADVKHFSRLFFTFFMNKKQINKQKPELFFKTSREVDIKIYEIWPAPNFAAFVAFFTKR